MLTPDRETPGDPSHAGPAADRRGRADLGRAGTAVLLVASSLTVMAGAVIAPVLAVLGDELGLSGTRAGLVLTTHALSLAIASPFVGRLVDRHGSRPVLVAGLVVYGVTGAAGAVSDGFGALLVTRVLFGLGAAAVFTATTVALLHGPAGVAQERAMGLRSAAMSLGGVFWPLVGGAAAAAGWRAPFLVYAVALPLAALARWTLPDPVRPARVSGHPAMRPSGRDRPLRQRTVGVVCGLFATGTALLYAVLAFLPARLDEIGHGTPLTAAGLGALMSLAMTVGGLRFGVLSRRHGPARLLPPAYALAAAGLLMLSAAGHLAATAVAVLLLGAGLGVTIPALTLLLGRAVPAEFQGRAAAASATAIFLGQFLSPLLVGPVIDRTSCVTGFAATAGIAVLASFAATTLRTGPSARVGAAGDGIE